MKHLFLIFISLLLSPTILAVEYSQVGKRLNIDPLLLRSIAIHESRENPWALNINGESCHKKSNPFVIKGKLIYCDSQSSSIKILKHVANNPWLLKTKINNKMYRFWFNSKRHAKRFKSMYKLKNVILLHKKTSSTDIGLMQVNWKYHYNNVGNIYKLLDPQFNLYYGAKYYYNLSKIYSRFVAIGKYHNKNNVRRQRNYQNKILTIYHKLKDHKDG